ncbi:hypothetical protein ACK3SF_03065 [Candidatus Nanosalina sp. VS9-1]|uniref:hypothetical protein n=1 Tax=Candidatus Nanosalina sp. VS9-1 TaxID=3388566 RepID=UPI0039E12E1A
MSSGPDVMQYDSIQDLEETIEHVYHKANRLNKEMEIFVEQAQSFLDYSHDLDMLKASAEYVERNLPDEASPRFVQEYARKELENPERAENWDRIQEAQDLTEGLVQQFTEAYEGLWNEFGYSDEKLHEKIEGRFPVQTFLREWEDNPHRLFESQERYSNDNRLIDEEVSGPTMARYFDIGREELTSKQRDDMLRGEELERELSDDHGRSFEDEDEHGFWRNHFIKQHDRDNPRSNSRWVNAELMFLENTMEGTPAPFNKDTRASAER